MLSKEEIAFFIMEDDSSERKQYARVGQRYYDGEHDILNYKLIKKLLHKYKKLLIIQTQK